MVIQTKRRWQVIRHISFCIYIRDVENNLSGSKNKKVILKKKKEEEKSDVLMPLYRIKCPFVDTQKNDEG